MRIVGADGGATGGLRAEILAALRDRGPLTKSQLAELAGVARSTVAAEVRRLEAAGLLEGGPAAPSTGGRRSTLLRVDRRVRYLVLHLGTTSARVAVLDGRLAPVTIRRHDGGLGDGLGRALPAPLATARSMAEALAEDGVGSRDQSSGGSLLAATIVVSGDVVEDGTVRFARTAGGRYDLDHLQRALEEAVGAPSVAVSAGIAEALGEAPLVGSTEDLVTVRLGATLSLTLLVGGRIHRGADGAAGAIAHLRVDPFGPACVCGRSGCLDSLVGGAALMRNAQEAAIGGHSVALSQVAARRDGRLRLVDVADAARSGDPVVVHMVREAGQRLGEALSAVVATLAPHRVRLGGPFVVLGDELLAAFRSAIYRTAPARATRNLTIEVGVRGEEAVLTGAGRAAGELLASQI
jgi:predicted NBD/HSP70 family sugar kinase